MKLRNADPHPSLPQPLEELTREVLERFMAIGPSWLHYGFGWGLPLIRGNRQIGYANVRRKHNELHVGLMSGTLLQDDWNILTGLEGKIIRKLEFRPEKSINWQAVEGIFLQACGIDARKG